MQAWKALGNFIGHHMVVIAPACLALGVAFPAVFSLVTPYVTVLFAFVTFQGGLGNNLRNLAQTVRHPLAMALSLAVSAVVMPCLAYVLGSALFGSDPQIVTGLVLEYCVPMAVISVMWTDMFEGNLSLCLASLLVSTVASPLTIPLTLKVLLGQTVAIDATGMMVEMLFAIALPALAGMVVNDRTDGWGRATLSPVLAPAARIALILVILSNSTAVAPYVRNLTPMLVGVTVFIGLFAATGYAWGIAIGRLTRRPAADVTSMTFLCGMRNISAGAVIASSYFPPEVMFPVIMGTLFQQVLAALSGTVVARLRPGWEAAEKGGGQWAA